MSARIEFTHRIYVCIVGAITWNRPYELKYKIRERADTRPAPTKYKYKKIMPNFFPKRPVKSFLDLEVYQKTLECAVFVAKYIVRPSADIEPALLGRSQSDMLQESAMSATERIYHQMLPCALGLPHLIAEAHSVRFGSQKDCLILLERAMLHCNKMVVYLEETRDICDTGVEFEKFAELIKKYLFIRQKTLNLQRSWKKYMGQN